MGHTFLHVYDKKKHGDNTEFLIISQKYNVFATSTSGNDSQCHMFITIKLQFSQLDCALWYYHFICPTNAQLDCSKRMLKLTLKVLLHVLV
jgi:hypothetical protein